MALTHERRRLRDLVTTVLVFGIQAVALAFGPLALVQPLVATEVLFALPMIAHRNMRPLMRKENRRRLGVASGMAILVASSPPTGGVKVPDLAAWVPALAGITGLTVLSASAAFRSRRTITPWLAWTVRFRAVSPAVASSRWARSANASMPIASSISQAGDCGRTVRDYLP